MIVDYDNNNDDEDDDMRITCTQGYEREREHYINKWNEDAEVW